MDAVNPTALWSELFGEIPAERTAFPWNPENVQKLTLRVREGISFSNIAAELGCSRSAAIGKAYRLKLVHPHARNNIARKPRPKPRPLHWTGLPKRKSPTKKPPIIVDDYQPPKLECVPLNIGFVDLKEDQCRYVIGDAKGADTVCCGLPSQRDKPYCAAHCQACYTNHPRGWTRPDYTYRLRKGQLTKVILQADTIDPISASELPEVA